MGTAAAGSRYCVPPTPPHVHTGPHSFLPAHPWSFRKRTTATPWSSGCRDPNGAGSLPAQVRPTPAFRLRSPTPAAGHASATADSRRLHGKVGSNSKCLQDRGTQTLWGPSRARLGDHRAHNGHSHCQETLKKKKVIYFGESTYVHASMGGGAEGKRESQADSLRGALHWARCHDPEITTWAETESWTAPPGGPQGTL